MTSEQILDLCYELADLGIDHLIFNMPNPHVLYPLEILGKEVIPIVR